MPYFTTADGVRLHYEDTGPETGAGRPPVLCLAGLTRNVEDFAHLPALLPERRVIRLSTRGRGLSGRAKDPEAEYQIPREAQDALELLAHLGVEKTVIIGTSRGGLLGMVIQALRPDLVAGLVLNDVGARIETCGLRRIAGYAGKPPCAESFAEAAEQLRDANAAAFPGVPLERWEEHARAIYGADVAGRPVLSYDPALPAVALKALEEAGPQIALDELWQGCSQAPVLALRGANSDILSEETLAEMMAGRTGCTAHQVPDRGHAPFLDEPAAIGPIRSFLEKTPPP